MPDDPVLFVPPMWVRRGAEVRSSTGSVGFILRVQNGPSQETTWITIDVVESRAERIEISAVILQEHWAPTGRTRGVMLDRLPRVPETLAADDLLTTAAHRLRAAGLVCQVIQGHDPYILGGRREVDAGGIRGYDQAFSIIPGYEEGFEVLIQDHPDQRTVTLADAVQQVIWHYQGFEDTTTMKTLDLTADTLAIVMDTTGKTQVFVGGQQVNFIKRLNLEVNAGDPPKAEIEFGTCNLIDIAMTAAGWARQIMMRFPWAVTKVQFQRWRAGATFRKARLRWKTREEGGREEVPTPGMYSTVARNEDACWSVVVHIPGPPDAQGNMEVEFGPLVESHEFAGFAAYMRQFTLWEGRRCVAEGTVI